MKENFIQSRADPCLYVLSYLCHQASQGVGVIAHVLIGKVEQTSVVGFTYTAITIFKSVL